MTRPRQKVGPYTLPLPSLPARPRWMNGDGESYSSGLARRLKAVKCIRGMTPAQRRADLGKRLSHDTEHDTTGRPVRSGGMQSWDAVAGRWRACPSLRAIRLAIHRAQQIPTPTR